MAKQIKTWVANTWVKLLQTTGQSTNKAMSQKAVTDSLDSLKSDLDTKANTSDVLSFEEIQASTDLTNKIAGADNISRLITNRVFNIKIFISHSEWNDYAYFSNVPIGDKASAIFIGNNNNRPIFRYCCLFNNLVVNDSHIDSGSIQLADNGDGTVNIKISGDIDVWGIYNLIVFYG